MRFRKTETTPEKPEDSALHRRFERKVRLSWLALLAERTPIDQLELRRLKKRKLFLKDQIAKIESELLPDIIA